MGGRIRSSIHLTFPLCFLVLVGLYRLMNENSKLTNIQSTRRNVHLMGEGNLSSVGEQSHALILPPVHKNSSWIGNQWIPPLGYRLYSPSEIQEFFSQQSVLFVGDSTARRSYATLYGILNGTTSDISVEEIDHYSVIDRNKNHIVEPCAREEFFLCRQLSNNGGGGGRFDYFVEVCIQGIIKSLQNPDSPLSKNLKHYTVVIFIIGPWEVMGKCKKSFLENSTVRLLDNLISYNSSSTQFVWRSWGYGGSAHSSVNASLTWKKRANMMNHFIKEYLDQQQRIPDNLSPVSYLGWGEAMQPRMGPPEHIRIAGDMDPHYGLEARLAFVQMLMDHLKEREKQEGVLNKNPYAEFPRLQDTEIDPGNETMDSIFFAFDTSNDSIVTNLAILDARKDLCSECLWQGQISCEARIGWMMSRYGMAELDATHLVLQHESSSCKKNHPVISQP